MFERRRITPLIVSVLLIAVVAAGALGYGVGRFMMPPEQVTTTTTETTTTTSTTAITTSITQVSTSLVTVTERLTTTTTSTVNRELPQTLPSPANSTAIIRGLFVGNGTVFMTFSIDKPSYSIGEIVHMKSTITNLTPNYVTVTVGNLHIDVRTSADDLVWTTVHGILGPYPGDTFYLSPGETKTLEKYMSADWNMKGNEVNYNSVFVPEGKYTVNWDPEIYYTYSGSQYILGDIHETILFTITK